MEKKTPFQRLSKLQIVRFRPILNQNFSITTISTSTLLKPQFSSPQQQPFLPQHTSGLTSQVSPTYTVLVPLKMLLSNIFIIAATALAVSGAHLPVKRDIIDLGITSVGNENEEPSIKRDIIDYGIRPENDNDSLGVKGDGFVGEGELSDGTKFKKFKRGEFDILDFGVHNITEDFPLSKRDSDWIQSCGPRSGWMPVYDVVTGSSPGSGYNTAAAAYCYHITHSLDNQATVLGHGMATSSIVFSGYVLSSGKPAQVAFVIKNQQDDGNHTPDYSNCIKYYQYITAENSSCYGKKNKDTKGGTYQLGSKAVSYRGIPGTAVN
ncbi:hypothetical protein ONS95_011038 [Cadophora gregata]|uniref:uncharacterized protein n=1 Tax=Cadophora gregata TaxID=51156 RepID=UPI0026DC4B41|nr:uncharacterized protein ONS95_011038 [Cadophora gregata]KAK0119598.1 hypothetical protein ONS95_011038 [Cadophora gregata]